MGYNKSHVMTWYFTVLFKFRLEKIVRSTLASCLLILGSFIRVLDAVAGYVAMESDSFPDSSSVLIGQLCEIRRAPFLL